MNLKHIFNYHVDIYPTTYIYIVYYMLMYISKTVNCKQYIFQINYVSADYWTNDALGNSIAYQHNQQNATSFLRFEELRFVCVFRSFAFGAYCKLIRSRVCMSCGPSDVVFSWNVKHSKQIDHTIAVTSPSAWIIPDVRRTIHDGDEVWWFEVT
jgi:hypothetical protein